MTYVPGTACYRCIFPEPPPKGAVPTCSEAGILGAVAGMLGTIQAAEALRFIIGKGKLLTDRLLTFNALDMEFRAIDIKRISDVQFAVKIPPLRSYSIMNNLLAI